MHLKLLSDDNNPFINNHKGNPSRNPKKKACPARDFEPKIPKFRHKNQFFWYLKIVTSQFSKIKKNNFSITLSVPNDYEYIPKKL